MQRTTISDKHVKVWCLTTLYSVVYFVFKSTHRITNHVIVHNILRKCFLLCHQDNDNNSTASKDCEKSRHIKWEVNKKGQRKQKACGNLVNRSCGISSTFSSSICKGKMSTYFSTQQCSMNISNSHTHHLLHFKYLLSHSGISSLTK